MLRRGSRVRPEQLEDVGAFDHGLQRGVPVLTGADGRHVAQVRQTEDLVGAFDPFDDLFVLPAVRAEDRVVRLTRRAGGLRVRRLRLADEDRQRHVRDDDSFDGERQLPVDRQPRRRADRANAEGEVRRSFTGRYGPLYQMAYMMGALQFYALKKELVDTGKMPIKQFHDTILRENNMPVEMVRAILTDQPLTPGHKTSWKFYGKK